MGFRGVNLDVCKCDNDGGDGSSLRFCHSVCGFGDRDPAQVFLEIMSFLTREVTEVVVLIFQFSTGDPTLADLFDVMMDVTGFVDLMYVHPRDEEMSWPKMGEMVAEKKVRGPGFGGVPRGGWGVGLANKTVPHERDCVPDLSLFSRNILMIFFPHILTFSLSLAAPPPV